MSSCPGFGSSRKRSLSFLVLLPLLSAPITPAAAPPAATPASHAGLAVASRKQFLAESEQALRVKAKVTPEFWSWLAQRPVIQTGLLCSVDPVPAEFAENLDRLRVALGPVASDRYASLLLAVSLTQQLELTKPTGGDGAYNASAYGSEPEKSADPAVAKVADYLKQKKLSLAGFVPQLETVFKELELKVPEHKERSRFIEELAFATKTYPLRQPLPLVDCLRKLIARYETKLPAFTDKGPQWPLFPIDTAPWPLLAPLRQTLPERELDYLWDRFTGKLPSEGKRLVTYSHYGFDYEKPEIRYKQSDWHPSALPRIIEDGGVCGRQSTLSQLSQVALGRPAVGMYQPGHRALLSYQFDPKTGHYSAHQEQGITSADKTTNQWYLPPPQGGRVREDGKNVGVEYHVALALAMNVGLDRYTDSRIAFLLANRLPATSRPAKQELLETATNLNPYDLEAWYALGKLTGSDTVAANQLLARLDTLLFAPDHGLAESKELSADTDLAKHAAKEQPADLRKESNLVATMVGGQIVEGAYQLALADKAGLEKNRANLKAELERRAKLKVPYGTDMEAMVYRYDIAADGPAKTQQSVAGEFKRLATAKPNQRKTLAQSIEQHVGLVLPALAQPADRVSWLKSLQGGYPESTRFQWDKKEKVVAEPLYDYLQKELIKALKATGKSSAPEIEKVKAEFETARAAFEKTKKS